MTIVEAIEKRKSCRDFDGQVLAPGEAAAIRSFIRSYAAPFGKPARLELVETGAGPPGTYGSLKGARNFLALFQGEASPAGGYLLEGAVLFCVSLGLATCWLGAFSGAFRKYAVPARGEALTHLAAVGRRAEEAAPRFWPALGGFLAASRRRPFGELFRRGGFETPLSEEEAGPFALPLAMSRLAPSAFNRQPWRAVLGADGVHFYRSARKPDWGRGADLGAALCHFGETCRESGLAGGFFEASAQAAPGVPAAAGWEYAVSWVYSRPSPAEGAERDIGSSAAASCAAFRPVTARSRTFARPGP